MPLEAGRAPACQSVISTEMNYEDTYIEACREAIERGEVKATLMRRGAVVTGWPSRWPSAASYRTHTRGIIRSASVRTLIRGGFQIANAPVDFDLMTTLTFRDRPENAKEALRHWCCRVELFAGPEVAWGWVQEYQQRGVVHYHVLHRQEDLANLDSEAIPVFRAVGHGKAAKTVLSGRLEAFIAETWMNCIGDRSMQTRRFNYGGITEVIKNPAAIGTYLGRYLAKLGQKTLPEGELPQGRWWWLSRAARPIPGEVVTLTSWPYARPHHLVYSHDILFSDRVGFAQPRCGRLGSLPE
jgi:hypothetical protein